MLPEDEEMLTQAVCVCNLRMWPVSLHVHTVLISL